MKRPLPASFFDRPTLTVARELLGKFLVRKTNGREIALTIVETEAYDGFKDMASHAHRGQTPRNTPMFGKPGHIYVYFTYGMHFMLNLVCGREKYPAAILIRGVCEAEVSHAGVRYISLERGTSVQLNGPAKLTKFLQIDKRLNTLPLTKKSGLWVEDRGVVIAAKNIKRTPRIGIQYAGEWAHKPYRFVLKK